MKKIVFDFNNVIRDSRSGEFNKEVLSIISDLYIQGFSLYLFTNISEKKLLSFLSSSDFSFEKIFKRMISASKCLKPNPGSFHVLLDIVGGSFEDIVFVDDSLRNVESARSFGIMAFQYLNPKDLEVKLKGVLKNDN